MKQFQANHGFLIQNEQLNGPERTLHVMERVAIKQRTGVPYLEV